MKFYLGVLLFLVEIYSCTYDKKVNEIKDSCRVTNKVVDCLDITENPDTTMLSKEIDAAQKKVLIIFTGRAISGKGLLDKDFLEKNEIFDELKKYSIYVLYVDERKKSNDSLIHDQRNMNYQMTRFSSVVHPHYITYSNGVKQCEEHYINNEDRIIQFLRCRR